jgi:tetratricopeptide (TPR) repeat protein
MNMLKELFVLPPRIGGFNFDQAKEKVLRDQYDAAVGQFKIELWNRLYEFYKRAGENLMCQDLVLEDFDAYWMEPFKADLYFKLGQCRERMNEYLAAADAYKSGLDSLSSPLRLQYYLNNNLGYCLLFKESFVEAEKYLRMAIKINDGLHHAWKNLGVSLEHQGKIEEAFACYCRAFMIESMDKRAAAHLLRMIKRNSIANVDELLDRHQMTGPYRTRLNHLAECFDKKAVKSI